MLANVQHAFLAFRADFLESQAADFDAERNGLQVTTGELQEQLKELSNSKNSDCGHLEVASKALTEALARSEKLQNQKLQLEHIVAQMLHNSSAVLPDTSATPQKVQTLNALRTQRAVLHLDLARYISLIDTPEAKYRGKPLAFVASQSQNCAYQQHQQAGLIVPASGGVSPLHMHGNPLSEDEAPMSATLIQSHNQARSVVFHIRVFYAILINCTYFLFRVYACGQYA